MAKKRKSKISKKRDKDVHVIENLVAKFANQFNQCKVIDTNDKKYKRKQKHKNKIDSYGVSIA